MISPQNYHQNSQIVFLDNELTDAAKGMATLVDTYKLDINALADGHVRSHPDIDGQLVVNISSSTNQWLNAMDCYLIGEQSFFSKQYSDAIQWFNETIKRANNDLTFNIQNQIYRYLSLTYHMIGDPNQALLYMQHTINMFPNNEQNIINNLFIDLFNKEIKEKSIKPQKVEEYEEEYEDYEEDEVVPEVMDNIKSESVVNVNDMQSNPSEDLVSISKELCRGVRQMNASLVGRLKCFYLNTKQIPFLRLTRIKVEEMYKRPQIVVIYDFLSENEVNVMKLVAKPRLQRSTVVGTPEQGLYIVADSRVAEGGWLVDTDHQVIQGITKRITAITGLDVRSADDYNCIKYGVGGHYVYHYDCVAPGGAKLGDDVYAESLNRVATWINYLSDVEAGGATIFPQIDVVIKPQKGAALFWYNLKSSGFVDLQTIHGGCPVLVGAKWIATKWINEIRQEFRKPCQLDKHAYHLLDPNI